MEPKSVEYVSGVDGFRDRYFLHDAGRGSDCLVYLHGHGSDGSQLFTREDIKVNLPLIDGLGLSVVSPDLRGNSWMCPAAVADLAEILNSCREKYGWKRFVFLGGSMGGTGALIFAVLVLMDCARAIASLAPVARREQPISVPKNQ